MSRQPGYLDPDEVFLDASNLPSFDQARLEGRIERSLSLRALYFLAGIFLLVGVVYLGKIANLQVSNGEKYRARSLDNSLTSIFVPNERGVIYDRNAVLLAWNEPGQGRRYTSEEGFGHLLGYLGYPEEGERDEGYDESVRVGKMGAERQFEDLLRGQEGLKIEEVDVAGNVISENMERFPRDGQAISLTVDAKVQAALYRYIKEVATERGFSGGAGVMLDVATGEIIGLVSYPEFSPALLSGSSTPSALAELFADERTPFLNRAISGLYAPGSIVKPIIATAALSRDIIRPSDTIVSTGSIEVPNPYSPSDPSVFKDWKAHGSVDMRRALAVSSNVYFYVVGGGYKGQKGLGIRAIHEYATLFGLGSETGIDLPGEEEGLVPTPDWKQATFQGDDWRLGDTYHTAIGQYGFLVTPIQMARLTAAIATGGELLTPHVFKGKEPKTTTLGLDDADLKVVREGMRLAVTEGTAKALDVGYVKFAAKTGTAELGASKRRVNSWIEGFFPYEEPRYAFAIVMERGAVGNTIGAASVANRVFEWMSIYTPEYFGYNDANVNQDRVPLQGEASGTQGRAG
jgi:penicillin-binding protein 2